MEQMIRVLNFTEWGHRTHFSVAHLGQRNYENEYHNALSKSTFIIT